MAGGGHGCAERCCHQPRARCHVAAAGMTALVHTIGQHLPRVARPGDHPAPHEVTGVREVCRTAHRRDHLRGGGAPASWCGRRGETGRDGRHEVAPEEPAAGGGERPPVRAVQAAHERVVGVAPLGEHARRRGRGPHRVEDLPRADREGPAGPADAQRQVRVLAVRPAEPLVEPVDGEEGRTAVHHVGGRPAGALEPRGGAFPVRGPTVRGKRHADPALRAGIRRAEALQVGDEGGRPALRDDDVVVEEGDPLRRREPPSEVARRCRPPPPAAHHAQRERPRRAARPVPAPGSGRSSTTTTSSGSGPSCAARALRSTARLGRPTVGTTTAYRGGRTAVTSHPRRTRRRGGRGAARGRGRRRERSRRAPGRRGGRRPSADPRC